ELGINLNGAPQQAYRTSEIVFAKHRRRCTKCAPRLEGSCGALLERDVVLFDGGQRFADSVSKMSSDAAQRVEDVLLPCGLRLLLIQNVARAACGAQPEHILTSQVCDRTAQDSSARRSLADLLGDLRRQSCVRRLSHQTERVLETLIRHETEEG